MVAVELAQFGLEELAGRAVREFVDKEDVIRHPPFGDLALIEGQQIGGASASSRACGRRSTSGRSSHFGCLTPITAASAISGCAIARFSSSIELIHSPPDLMTSLERSVICMKPSASMVATSPVKNQPSGRSLSVHLVIAARDPGPADQQIAKSLAVVRQILVVAIANADFDAEHRASLLDLAVALRSFGRGLRVWSAAWRWSRPGWSPSCPRHAAFRRHNRLPAPPSASAGRRCLPSARD